MLYIVFFFLQPILICLFSFSQRKPAITFWCIFYCVNYRGCPIVFIFVYSRLYSFGVSHSVLYFLILNFTISLYHYNYGVFTQFFIFFSICLYTLHFCFIFFLYPFYFSIYVSISHITYTRISEKIEPKISLEQAGFRPERSFVVHINTLCIITEQSSVQWLSAILLWFLRWARAPFLLFLVGDSG